MHGIRGCRGLGQGGLWQADGPSGGGVGPEPDPLPALIEGLGGGPAMPVGPAISPREKRDAAEMESGLMMHGAGWAVVSAIAGGFGLAPFAAIFGVISGVIGLGAVYFHDIALDPPKPYAAITVFLRRRCNFRDFADPVSRPLAVVAQTAVFFNGHG